MQRVELGIEIKDPFTLLMHVNEYISYESSEYM